MSDNYKRLLPAPMPPGSAHASAPEASFPKDSGPPVKKRTVSKAACNNCRLKKIRVSSPVSPQSRALRGQVSPLTSLTRTPSVMANARPARPVPRPV